MGGGSISASGFALYLDRLMNLVKPESSAGSERILVRAEVGEIEALKGGSNIASSLREAGYITELDLGSRELADFRWILDVSKGPLFVLSDQVKHRKFKVQTAKEVWAILGEEGADKTSFA